MTDGELALYGSIFQYYSFIREHLTRRLREALPGVSVIAARYSAAHGAALLAMKLFKGAQS